MARVRRLNCSGETIAAGVGRLSSARMGKMNKLSMMDFCWDDKTCS